MNQDNNIDLDIALQKLHELALADGDLGYTYWYQVGQLLKRAAGMQEEEDGRLAAVTRANKAVHAIGRSPIECLYRAEIANFKATNTRHFPSQLFW
ncbi:hypothetical protein [Laribacter hongkongensis]|uniref:hypothetical protein n=1 Tax=Laribacter hongkongensis TaxID=168471 RepID=UPI001EFE911E|nr:hypothetical protein [Laribacter hongkongensis]